MFDIRKIQEQVLFHAVEEESDRDTATTIVRGDPTRSEDDATWVTSTMKRLERRFDRPTLKRIRMQCQCGYGMEERLAFVRALVASSSSLEEFADQPEARAAGLSCIDGSLYLQFPSCPCPMLAQVTRLHTDTWCQCTTGYSKVLFEQAFGCEVEVELLKSIKMGDDICLMKIVPLGAIWRSEPWASPAVPCTPPNPLAEPEEWAKGRTFSITDRPDPWIELSSTRERETSER